MKLKKPLLLAWGKVRRFFLIVFFRDYVEKSIRKREGECARCGDCCKLLFQCPHYDDSVDPPVCRIHVKRPLNCRYFPINERDIKDRELIGSGRPCGYSFPSRRNQKGTES